MLLVVVIQMQGRFANCKSQFSESKCLPFWNIFKFQKLSMLFSRRLTFRMKHYVYCFFADEVIKPRQASPVLFQHGFWCSTETPAINILHLICAVITKHTREILLHCAVLFNESWSWDAPFCLPYSVANSGSGQWQSGTAYIRWEQLQLCLWLIRKTNAMYWHGCYWRFFLAHCCHFISVLLVLGRRR